MSSDTPRTDAERSVSDHVRGSFARQLERDLNEMRERAENAEKERDNAMTELDAWHKVFGTTQLSHATERFEAVERKLSAFVLALDADGNAVSAMVELQRLKKASDNAERYRLEANAMMMQRDEARAALLEAVAQFSVKDGWGVANVHDMEIAEWRKAAGVEQ